MSVNLNLNEEIFDGIIRTSPFVKDNNRFYNSRSNNGISVYNNGNPSRHGANTLCNCTAFAWGAYNETLYRSNPSEYKGFVYVPKDAKYAYEEAKKKGIPTLAIEDTPPLGGIIVWGGTANHMAYISKVIDKDTIEIMQSGWGYAPWTLRNNANTGWVNDCRIVRRNQNGSNVWGYRGSGIGFIKNTAVYAPLPQDSPATIYSVTQTDRSTIEIKGNMGGIDGITTDNIIYYKWNSNTVSLNNYDGYIYASSGSVVNKDYTLYLTKPYEAESISVIPYQVNTGYENFAGAIFNITLIATIPCIYINSADRMVQSIPYVYYNGQWKKATPMIYSNNKWNIIYNDKE